MIWRLCCSLAIFLDFFSYDFMIPPAGRRQCDHGLSDDASNERNAVRWRDLLRISDESVAFQTDSQAACARILFDGSLTMVGHFHVSKGMVLTDPAIGKRHTVTDVRTRRSIAGLCGWQDDTFNHVLVTPNLARPLKPIGPICANDLVSLAGAGAEILMSSRKRNNERLLFGTILQINLNDAEANIPIGSFTYNIGATDPACTARRPQPCA